MRWPAVESDPLSQGASECRLTSRLYLLHARGNANALFCFPSERNVKILKAVSSQRLCDSNLTLVTWLLFHATGLKSDPSLIMSKPRLSTRLV